MSAPRCPHCGEIPRQRKWTRERLLDHLRAEAARLGRTPTQTDLPGMSNTYHRAFGGLRAAQAEAGLVPNRRGRPPREGA